MCKSYPKLFFACLALAFQWSALGAAPSAQDHLKAAFAADAAKNPETVYLAALEAINDPGFSALASGIQHAAFSLAGTAALATGKADQAHQLAVRATQLPQQGIDDWRLRMSASFRLKDYRDEAVCVTAIARQWGRDSGALPADSVLRAYRETRSPEYRDVQLEMLSALYDLRWRPATGRNPSGMWRTLSLDLVETNQAARGAEVAALVDDPDDVIAMRANLRYKPLLRSKYFDSDAHRVARKQIESLREAVQVRPRSMAAVVGLARALLISRFDTEALELTAVVDGRMAQSREDSPAYDDINDNYHWILDAQSRALRHLGRYDQAVAALKRAVELPRRSDAVSQPINLAELLCELDRPEEALQLLPADDKASDYGRMQITSVRLTAAVERGNRADIDSALAYLREHQADGPATLQRALLRAGETNEAEQVLVARLTDPAQQTEALVEMQTYSDKKRTPREQAWYLQAERLKQQPAVRAAAAKVGVTESYLWRYQ
jgi:tetratricopeptide (TPR) repeat protein